MMQTEEIKSILTQKFSDAQIEVIDLTGTYDHFEVKIIWNGFGSKSLIEQHQMINRALEAPLNDGRIHALKIKTQTLKK